MPAPLWLAILLAAAPPVDVRTDLSRFAMANRGDAKRGQAVFEDTKGAGCLKCHRVRGKGTAIGPDLSNVGGKYAREHLIESILEPSRQIVEGYRPTVLALEDGRVLTGLVRSETSDRLTLVDAEARESVVAKAEIAARKFGEVSIMPEGLATGLGQERFADLVTYLQSLRDRDQPTPGSGAVGPIRLAPGFESRKVVGGLTAATALAVVPDGRVFVAEQTGTLRVVKDGQLLPEPFISLDVDSTWERGLIGVTLDPEFPSNGFVYVTYVAREPYPHHRIARFTARGDVAAPGSEVVLLRGDDQRKLGGVVPAGHQGGALHFGRDGKLYIAIGEQTARSPSQRLDTFQGKLLRINPDGTIPTDNPFYLQARGKYRAIWALGLRNPFTFAVSPRTGRILINDVGDNRWEEINEGVPGANYGWPESEGKTSIERFRGPIYTYPVASIAGGAFGPEVLPPQYRGRYFFMDFVQGWIKTLDPDHPSDVRSFATGLSRPSDLAFAADGRLFVLLRDAWVIDGKFRPHSGSLLEIRSSAGRDSMEIPDLR